MGLFDWLKRKSTGDPSSTTFTVTTHDLSVDTHGPRQRAALEQVDRLIHEILTDGAEQEGAGSLTLAASTQVIVDGQTVSPDDPRALEAMGKAAAKLREQGLDELAAALEARTAVAPAAAATAAAGTPPLDLPPIGGDAQPLPAPAADDLGAAPSAATDDLGAAPTPPTPPEPPAPPS